MVDAQILEIVEPGGLIVAPSRPSNTVVRKPIQKSFRPWTPQKFKSLGKVEAFAVISNLSHYRQRDAVYVAMNEEWFIFIQMYGRIWSRPAVRVQAPTLDVQLLTPIGHSVCEHCGKIDVLSNYVILVCLGHSYRICKKHLKTNTLDYVKSRYKVEIISD